MAHKLNRKETTLRTFNPEMAKNLALCAGNRARLQDRHNTDRITAEYDSASLWWDKAKFEQLGPFPAILPDGIVSPGKGDPRHDSLLLDTAQHLENSLSTDSVSIPSYVWDALDAGKCDTVCNYLQAIDDTNSPYTYHVLQLSGDLSYDVAVTVYVKSDAADYLWSSFFAAVGTTLYDCTDSTVADCDLLGTTLGFYVTHLEGEYIEGFDCLSAGYSGSPVSQLERLLPLTKGLASELVTWHHGFQCFIARLKGNYAPVLLHVETPSYSG